MNRRIKTVWSLCVVAALMVFGVQAYWLYSQLQYNLEHNAESMKQIISKALEEDQNMRYALADHKKEEKKNRVKMFIRTELKDYYDSVQIKKGYFKKSKKTFTTVTISIHGLTRTIKLRDISLDDAVQLSSRYEAQHARRFSKRQTDSILVSMGCDTTVAVRQYNTNRCMIHPQFSLGGGVFKTLTVDYSVNPMEYEAVRLTIPIPVGKAITDMGWQLLFAVLLFGILCFCMTYLIRTIVFQKRIDRLRQEFIKNMMYEQKAAPEQESTPADAVKIGRTDFYYMANELRYGSDRVIITSRQAEILRLLADRKNEVVSREELLEQVWGDDSYSNSKALNVQITYLRRALKADETVNIETVIRKGYSLREMKN